ncbi:hypothetical protein RHGRI_024303 [Rhododendron griersonianum]|uniref:Uncharacterized protein n=1 Tax=Rhododendron griersonianum TaxID=479676 RepID=A0AAV6JE56_9ERIC|nr:hypothetical protein RHGRI_024303 [Rhododendron griersonianum]
MFSPHFPSPINPPQPHNISHNITPSQPTPNFFDHQPLFDQTTALHATTTNPSPLLTLSPPISLAEAVPTTTTTQPTQPSLPFVTQTFTHAPLSMKAKLIWHPSPSLLRSLRCFAARLQTSLEMTVWRFLIPTP